MNFTLFWGQVPRQAIEDIVKVLELDRICPKIGIGLVDHNTNGVDPFLYHGLGSRLVLTQVWSPI